ncbi:transposase [Thioalkalivibrio sp. ALE21]|nr:transposase [Thioalkalivibrio sp. ALE21]
MAETRADAEQAFDAFLAAYGDKYPKAADTLAKDREDLLAFYDFPAPHWQSIRTTNPIESTFATVRLRTAKTRGCVTRNGVTFIDGIEQTEPTNDEGSSITDRSAA